MQFILSTLKVDDKSIYFSLNFVQYNIFIFILSKTFTLFVYVD